MIPELFKIGPFTIYTYGVMVALGFLLGTFITVKKAATYGYEKEKVLDLIVWLFVASLVGARVLYVLTDLAYYAKAPLKIFAIWEGGLVYYGGFIGGVTVFFLLAKRFGFQSLKMADAIMPGIVAGQILGRLGCFTRGCCYGMPSDNIGMVFPGIGDGVKYFPSMLLEAAGLAFIFILLNSMKKKSAGQVFFRYLLYYGVLRFLVEFTRGDFRGPSFFGLSVSQFISVVIVAAATISIIVHGKKKENAS